MSTTSAATSARVKLSKDPGWDYGQPLPDDKNAVKCDFCNTVTNGGINRHKQHLVGGYKNASACSKVSKEVQEIIRKYMEVQDKKKKEKQKLKALNLGIENINVFESGSNAELARDSSEAMDPPPTTPASSSGTSHLKPKIKGPLDSIFPPKFDNLVQKPIDNIHRKVARDNTCEFVCDFIFENGLSFNVVNSPSFTKMLAAVGQFGPNFKGPTYHEVRGRFLNKKVDAICDWIEELKVHWKNYGCTIMCDWWTDGRRRTLINFLVNCPKGTVSLKSIDGSAHSKTAELCHEMLLEIITDNASNFKKAGGWIQDDLKIYWTPCAAHCVNLMCEDISEIQKFAEVVLKCKTVTRYIYNHVNVLSMMRRYTNDADLTRPASTRFATCCLSMESIHKVKAGLKVMMVSAEWTESDWAKTFDGKRMSNILKRSRFWKDLDSCLKVFTPLVNLIRRVDSEETPAMGYIYQAVDQLTKQVPLMLSDPKDKIVLDKVMKIIRERWSEQLHQPLHAAGYYLNPSIYFSNPPQSGEDLDSNANVKKGLIDAIAMLFPDDETQDKIINQLLCYRSAAGMMGLQVAKRNRATTSPVEWWINWGSEVPELQRFAKRVLGLTVSASPCERNWSAFNNLHTKKRNRLDHEKLNNLVFVSYNSKLRARYLDRTSGPGKGTDPLIVKDYETTCAEWLAPFHENEECLDGEDHDADEEDIVHVTRQYKKTVSKGGRSPADYESSDSEDNETDNEDDTHTTTSEDEKSIPAKEVKKPTKTRGVNELYNSDSLEVGEETRTSILQRRKRKAIQIDDSSDSLDDDVPLISLRKKKKGPEVGKATGGSGLGVADEEVDLDLFD
ncbi:hypothetical protein MKW92_005599 [Papaver armeniacum]|nr:hypothetical protein MKW92_005599 [Papaver armeniacum]